mmetsp:Transcript_105101/g.208929  ORF Transcript_105101/g.208929 Transcript_105101/m.208929 type:complete len:578 (-) Transcript_105101:82-1815(-)
MFCMKANREMDDTTESPIESKVLRFDDVMRQLAASHQAELNMLSKRLEEDRDRWRNKARQLETSMAQSGSLPLPAHTVTSREVSVQTHDGPSGVTGHNEFTPVAETEEPDDPAFLNVMRSSIVRRQPSLSVDGSRSRHSNGFNMLRRRMRELLDWPGFDFSMGIVIAVNSIMIGFQSDFSIDHEANRQALDVFEMLDYIFLGIYVLELAFRFIGHGRRILEDPWIKFDVVLVTMGLVGAFMSFILAVLENQGEAQSVREHIESWTLLRILRLCRMVRAVRMLGKWQTLWRLVKGIQNGLETMASTVVMILFTLFVFACFGVELISRDEHLQEHKLTKEIVEDRFNSLLNIFCTLLQFVLVDGISDIYFPFIKVRPLLVLYFGTLVSVLSILLANLVTAILVEDCLRMSQMDEKMDFENRRRRFEQLEPQFQKAFRLIDKDSDGQVGMNEFMDYRKEMDEVDEIAQHLRPEFIAELFDVLDEDDSGHIGENEFLEGMMRLALSEESLEMAQIKGLVKQTKRQVRKVAADEERILAILGDTSSTRQGRTNESQALSIIQTSCWRNSLSNREAYTTSLDT